MKKIARASIYFGPVIILTLFILAWIYVIHPQVTGWIQSKLPELNSSQDYVTIKYEDLDISLLKLKVTANNVVVIFKNDLSKYPEIQVGSIKAQLNPFDLLIGQIDLSSITLDKIHWQLSDSIFTTNNDPASEIPVDLIFKYLPQVPVSKIKITNSDFNFLMTERQITLHSIIDSVVLENHKKSVSLDISKLQQYVQSEKNEPTLLVLNLATHFNSSQLTVDHFDLQSLDSKIKIKGQLNQIKKTLIHPSGEFAIESTIHGDNLRTLFLNLWPQKSRIPSLTGQVQTKGTLRLEGLKDINGQFQLNTENISVDHFKFGQAQVKMQIKKNQLLVNQIEVEHPAGLAELNEIEIGQEKPYLFKAKLKVKSFNLQKLFASLNLNSIPADLDLAGSTTCAGQLLPPFDIECDVDATAENIWVKPGLKEALTIVKVKKGHFNGNLILNQEDIQFESKIEIGKSNGIVKGVVDYKRGFKIDFDTTNLNIKDIDSLAGLDLAGQAQLKGFTWGDSSQGQIQARLSLDQGEIEQFVLGQFTSDLKYQDGQLFFNKLMGHLGQSNYQGDLSFDFPKSSLSGKISAPQLSGADVFTALKKRFYIPFDLTGTGSADILVSGPFDFWKLKYTLASHLEKGQIAEEGFEKLDLNLVADGKHIDFKNVVLKKLRSEGRLTGFISTEEKQPHFQLGVKTNQAYLEEVDHLARLAPALTGQISASGTVEGTIELPELKFNFNTKQVNLDGIDYLPSQGQVGLTRKYLTLVGQLSGRQIQANVKWPWKETDDYDVKLQVRDLNPLLFLPLLSLPQTTNEYYSRLSFDVDLKSNTRQLNHANGQMRLTDFFLQRGGQSIKLKKSSLISFESGLKKMEPIELTGDENQIDIKLVSPRKNENNLDFNVAVKLRLLQFLVPFVDTLSGQIEAQAQMSLNSQSLQLFGEGALVDAGVKLKGFPTPIEGITSPIEFSQSKIFFNDITAHVGSSDLIGSGQIDIKGSKNINVQFQAQADSIELTFPEGVTTAGKADLSFFGTWLPYNLKVNYKVGRGLVEKDFGAENSSAASLLKGSQYLPPKQFEQQAPSLMLDVAIDLTQGVVVKNKLVEGVATGNLTIQGTPENPAILGKIEIRPGSKIFFKDKPFDVQTANIQFTQAKEINPNIFISALARVSDYDINLVIQGPAKSPSIKPTSQPPLSEPDIFSLLALGMTSSKMDQNLSSETQQAQTSLEILAAISNQSQINKKIQEKLGLTVQLAPTVDSTKNIAVPKVIVSKKIGKKMNASYARPLTGDNQNHEVKLQYLFNRNFSGNLNYQNKDNTQQETNIQNQKTIETGILGLDMEYKEEFK